MSLLDDIADEANVTRAFWSSLRGKRSSLGPQKVFLRQDAALIKLREDLLLGPSYPWGHYRSFYVSDPKRRIIHAAPFVDRVAHAAIYQILEPILSDRMLPCAYACRIGRGNSHAVIRLMEIMREAPHPYVVKLDVRQFFVSISHRRLMAKLRDALPDGSAEGLIRGLLKSHPDYTHGVGLPLGNLTSQIFANYYLHDLDVMIAERLDGRYVRYMDDLVLVMQNRQEARSLVAAVIAMGKTEKLHFPRAKRVWLGHTTEVPFLGFRVSGNDAVPLARNLRRFARRLRKMKASGQLVSDIARRLLSHDEWRKNPLRAVPRHDTKDPR